MFFYSRFFEGEKADIQEVIDDLQGSCQSINHDEFTSEELQEIDENIFECLCCGWWCETGDYASEDFCEEQGGNCCSECEE